MISRTRKTRSHRPIAAAEIFRDLSCFLAFGFGSGLAPVAPGTFGTLVAVPIYWLVASLDAPIYALTVIAFLISGVYICGRCEKLLKVQDHPGIVWDEIAGFLITMMFAPASWEWVLIGFLVFRLFDIWKPWPIAIIDRTVHGGLGIMIDDALAGIYAAICLLALRTGFGI
ncbi:phosphatidylglycerophosphatase A [Methylocaldum sp.]|uniref:phosphatidylglycerophosphatase A family protein n=1 Tax=Methylocaldum sp. TaxID=1969727 RepID=UPI002D5E7F32|nr:phosphatidylglycerophosphatase A [Methylocaldum sp.]HYE37947.1 phosphatidylglycerophosphatase A [Methylocaldum sp.]